jgi:hypothetical protein
VTLGANTDSQNEHRLACSVYTFDDDDVYFKKDYNEGVIKSYPTQKCRPAKGISKRVNMMMMVMFTS